MPQYSNIETPAINMVTIKIIMDNFNLVEDFNIKNGDSNRTITKTIMPVMSAVPRYWGYIPQWNERLRFLMRFLTFSGAGKSITICRRNKKAHTSAPTLAGQV